MASNVRDCDCGFIDANDPTGSIFSSLLVVDFESASNEDLDDLFITATYDLSRPGSPYTETFSEDQVLQTEGGLQLTVSPSEDGQTVPCAQVFTRAETFLYGSYSAKFRVGDVPGTVTALFNYYNDTSEVDIEYLSAWDSPTLLYSVKPQIYLDNGNPANSTYETQEWNGSPGAFDSAFHEWSFVWLPNVVHFGLDGDYSRSLTTNVPSAPGKVALSHWSDGNQNYSLGPPTQNSTIIVASLQAVYNDTNATELACKKVSSACTIRNGILQGSAAPGGDDGGSLAPVTSVNSAHLVTPAAPGWLFLILMFTWLFHRHGLK